MGLRPLQPEGRGLGWPSNHQVGLLQAQEPDLVSDSLLLLNGLSIC